MKSSFLNRTLSTGRKSLVIQCLRVGISRTRLIVPSASKAGLQAPRRSRHVAYGTERRAAQIASSPTEALQADRITLPIDFTTLLGLDTYSKHTDEAIQVAFEDLTRAPVDNDFSASCVKQRKEVLEMARSQLKQRNRSNGAAEDSINLPRECLPGVILLMTQVEQYPLSLSLGHQLLESMSSGPEASARSQPGSTYRDITLSLVITYCGLASKSLEGVSANASSDTKKLQKSCEYLEAALGLLVSCGNPPLAPQLALRIREGLTGLRSQQLLGEMTGEAKSLGRNTYVERLKHMLMQDERLDPGIVVQLLQALSADELVGLFNWKAIAEATKPYSWATSDAMRHVGAVHLAYGFAKRHAPHIIAAASVLAAAPASSEILVMRSITALLMADADAALELLAQEAELVSERDMPYSSRMDAVLPSGMPAPGCALAFVACHSTSVNVCTKDQPLLSANNVDGALLGLGLLTQYWLNKVGIPLVSNLYSSDLPSLASYFEDVKVECVLAEVEAKMREQGPDKKTTSNAADESRATTSSSSSSASSSPPSTSSPSPSKPGFIKALTDGDTTARAIAAGALVLGAIGAAFLYRTFTSAPAPARQLPHLPTVAPVAVTTTPSLTTAAPPSPVPVAIPTPSPATASTSSAPVKVQMAQEAPAPPPAAVVPAPPTVTALPPLATSSSKRDDAKLLEDVVRRWQNVKAEALGQQYDTSRLSSVLTGKVLNELEEQVDALKEEGLYTKYNLGSCEVVRVDLKKAWRGQCMVRARLAEAAIQVTKTGAVMDSYSSCYDVVYKMKLEDGVWKISSLMVVEHH